jgi:hypothetical protein
MTSLPEERFILKGGNPNQLIEKGLYFFSWEKTRKKGKSSLSPLFLIELSSKKRDKKNEIRNTDRGSS